MITHLQPKKTSRPGRAQASANTFPDFQLHSLGWKAFQDLCLTVLDHELGQNVQRFSPVKDGGRDGAFAGRWKPRKGVQWTGETVVQCKFTNRRDVALAESSFENELQKIRRLWQIRPRNNYLLLTNYRITGNFEETMRGRCSEFGCHNFLCFGYEWLAATIQQSARLRTMIPRLYGLGDLSQILDERWYSQTQKLLESQRENLKKFVPTWSYRRSVTALNDHGFVLLLGEPAVGKTAIAATLTLASGDAWKCRPMKVERPSDLRRRWNPDDPHQLFWIDDAFGETQYDSARAHDWNSIFPWMDAVLRSGSKVILTSRDYIYAHARPDLKQSAFPLLKESQVVVDVENLTAEEREQILYNHIRLGDQPAEWRARFKEFFDLVAQHRDFRPEVARRLGSRAFTKHLWLSSSEISSFVENPEEFLKETIEGLSDGDKSALAAIFLRGGELQSPVRLSGPEEEIITRLGGTPRAIRYGLNAMRGSFVDANDGIWKFRHPTIADAFAALMAENPEFIDLYIGGASIEKVLSEVSCGQVRMEGIKIVVPESQFNVVMSRLNEYITTGTNDWWARKNTYHSFLANRCSKKFLKQYIRSTPSLIPGVLEFHSYLSAVSEFSLIVTLGRLKLLGDADRGVVLRKVKELAVEIPDADFLTTRGIRDFFTTDEIEEIMAHVKSNLLPRLENIIRDWKDNYSSYERDAESYYATLKEALVAYREYFQDEDKVRRKFTKAINKVKRLIDSSTYHDDEDDPNYGFDETGSVGENKEEEEIVRRIFDDIDA